MRVEQEVVRERARRVLDEVAAELAAARLPLATTLPVALLISQ